jgi:hypothetical protein
MSQFLVGRIDTLNTNVNRVFSKDEKYILDIPKQCFLCTEGDILSIKCLEKPIKTCAYIMNGYVYNSDQDSACISCGGLLVHIPSSISSGTNVYISISKGKKTLSSMERDDMESKPRTRQKKHQ